MRIATLLARHGTDRYPDAIQRVDSFFKHRLPEVEHHLVVSDTALSAGRVERISDNQVVIGSSNAFWEFSAWDGAIDFLGRQLDDHDLVHIATSAFGAIDARHLDDFDHALLTSVIGRRVAVGRIDYLTESIMVDGQESQAWLRSSWIMLPPRALRGLGSLVSFDTPGRFFSGRPNAPFRSGAPISRNFQAFIIDYLTGALPGRGWHSSFALTPATLSLFEAKTLAIVNEHMLSIRLRSLGYAMVDITWLASRHGQSLSLVPSWRWQASAREMLARSSRSSLKLRAALVVGEAWAITGSHGVKAAQPVLWRSIRKEPWLLTQRPVLGALRRCFGRV
jgi:hypothetical protein